MLFRLFTAGLAGLAIGAITGLLAFGSILSGVGIGIVMGAAICGVLIAYGFEEN